MQENDNTRKKTQQNAALLKEFLTLRNESRVTEEILPKELRSRLLCLLLTVDFNLKLKTFVVSQYKYNKQITSWLVRLSDFYSLAVKNSKRTSESWSEFFERLLCLLWSVDSV